MDGSRADLVRLAAIPPVACPGPQPAPVAELPHGAFVREYGAFVREYGAFVREYAATSAARGDGSRA
ncbi:hypothetical protein [Streptomyces aureocirculatus]|uniref:hypothetical protein n=1 Tax=Streptomyces aureocirculatus TaxID=67275 RepID=UPI0004CA53DD|nr:hypothetical protein [Streptomyces aureocirculatus]